MKTELMMNIMTQLAILEAINITGGYGKKSIVQDIDLNLQPGEWLSLIGANGSGKSTLLRLMTRLLQPQQGVVLLDGEKIHKMPPQQLAQQLALLPQQQTVPSGLTVYQLVSLGRSPHQPWWQWELNTNDRHHVEVAISQTQLSAMQHRPVEDLSGGERQRAFLALALAQNPKVLLLDEPTTYLDVHYQLELLQLLQDLNQNHQLSIVTVLHELNLAMRFSDRIAMLKSGKILALGVPETIMTPENLAAVFNLDAVVIETPVGRQICAIGSTSSKNRL